MTRVHLFALAAMMAGASSLPGAVIYSNFGPGDSYDVNSRWFVGFALAGGGETRMAAPFSHVNSFQLTSIQVPTANGVDPNSFTVTLNADNNGTPGAVIESFSNIAFTTQGGGMITLNSSLNPLIGAGSTNWIVLRATAAPTYGWWYINDQNLTGIWTASKTQQFTWLYTSTWPSPAFQINGTAVTDPNGGGVPEPSAIVLTALGVAGLVVRRRHIIANI